MQKNLNNMKNKNLFTNVLRWTVSCLDDTSGDGFNEKRMFRERRIVNAINTHMGSIPSRPQL